MTWVQLLRPQNIEQRGVRRTFYRGDWVDVGRQTAQRWVIDGAARYAAPPSLDSLDGCGIVALPGSTPIDGVPVTPSTTPELAYARTLVLATKVRPELLAAGFGLLSTWEVAVPLWDYDQLAVHIGTPEARERTQALIGDLRVPLYECRMVWVQRCRAGEALLEAWGKEKQSGDDDRLCFLRAVWRVKPLLCATPVTWHKEL